MSTERTSFAVWEHAPLAISVAAFLGPGLHFIAFDGFSQPQAASDAAMFGVPIAGVALFLAAAALIVTLGRTASRNELAWAMAIALGAAVVWGTVLMGDSWAFGPLGTASKDNAPLKPIELLDYGPQGDGTHVLIVGDRSIRVDLQLLASYGLQIEEVKEILQRGFCSVVSPEQLAGAYSILGSLDVALIGMHNGYPVYLEEVAVIRRM